jgi:hypothetical protein
MITVQRGFIASALLAIFSAFAFAAPIPVSSLGWGQDVTVVTNPLTYPVTVSGVGVGGGFSGTVAGHQTIFWCVDSQLFVSWGTNNYKANVTPLTGINQGAWNGSVRYEDVTGTTWHTTFGPINSINFDTAEARYRMAAWLVSQYLNFPAGPTPDNNATNRAIQGAIWRTMLNTTLSYDSDVPTLDISSGVPSGYSTWIDAAKAYVSQNYNDPFFNNWAIVSGGVKWQNGSWVFDSGNAKQTFLVQTTPEPGFYGLLALGLAGLLLAFQKRSAMSLKKQ